MGPYVPPAPENCALAQSFLWEVILLGYRLFSIGHDFYWISDFPTPLKKSEATMTCTALDCVHIQPEVTKRSLLYCIVIDI